MAFHSLSHKMSVPQHSSEPTPQHLERGSHEQFLFRQREKEDEKEDVCGSNLRSLVQSGKELGGGGGEGKNGAPTWLSSAILRQQNQQYAAEGGGREEGRKWCGCCEPGSRGCVQCSFLNLTAAPSNSAAMPAQWLPRAFRRGSEVLGEDVTPAESMMALSHGSADVKNQSARAGLVDLQSSDTANSGDLPVDSGGGGGEREADDGNDNHAAGLWQNAKFKADILSHPLYEQLLSAHVACLRIATPVDQLPRIDAQLAQSQHVVSKYSLLASNNNLLADEKELDQFMVSFLSFLLKLPLETDPFAIALICEIYLAFICTLSVEISLRCLIFIVFPFSNLTSNCVFRKKSGNL